MSKSFTQAPKPLPLTAEVITAFERGGAGQDTRNHIPTKLGMWEPTNEQTIKPKGVESIPLEDRVKMETTKVGMGESVKVELSKTTNVEEPMRRLSIDLPVSWHRRFKTACSKADKKMIAEVTEFIKRRTIELEKE